MDFDEIDRFIETADSGSFSSAADRLNITPQGLGYSVRKLEKDLGLELLEKNSQGVALTETGRKVYAHFVEIKKHMTRIQALSDIENRKNVRFRCAYKPSNIGNKVADKLRELKDRYLFDLELVECRERGSINQACREGRCDIAFTYLLNFDPGDTGPWEKNELFTIDHTPFVNVESSVAGSPSPKISDLSDMVLAFHSEQNSSWFRQHLLHYFEDHGLKQFISVESGSMHATVEFISRNENVVAFLPSTFDRKYLESFSNIKKLNMKDYPKTIFCAFVHSDVAGYDKLPLIVEDLRNHLKISAVHD